MHSIYASQPFFRKGSEWVSQIQLSSCYNTVQLQYGTNINTQEHFNKKNMVVVLNLIPVKAENTNTTV